MRKLLLDWKCHQEVFKWYSAKLWFVYKVRAGAGDQGYHGEDHIHHTIHQACDSFQYGKETQLGVGVAFTRILNKANGATRVIIGSHLWAHRIPVGNSTEVEFHVNAAKGDAVLFWAAFTTMQKVRTIP
nr:AKR_HP1_G0022390.mRNA.1.CDS.1 [Saccharomyces cerevisiae]